MYKLINNNIDGKLSCILRIADNTWIPINPDNSDYQAYLKFLADGGTPLPAESN